jgi:hypothetical protein
MWFCADRASTCLVDDMCAPLEWIPMTPDNNDLLPQSPQLCTSTPSDGVRAAWALYVREVVLQWFLLRTSTVHAVAGGASFSYRFFRGGRLTADMSVDESISILANIDPPRSGDATDIRIF